MIYDITRTVSPTTSVWPGDCPYTVTPVYRMDEGKMVNLTTLTFSPHTGTHIDATYHTEPDGLHPAAMPLDAYIGPARVVTITRRSGALTPNDFQHLNLAGVERLLLHSWLSDLDDDQWSPEFPYLDITLIDWLAAAGVRLIGLDMPSLDAFDSTELTCHHAISRYRMVNIERLQLRGVPDGDYELIALPLKLDKTCGSPVRAILRTL
ncbi:MAG TPA: cyclase family protein [Phototrophicaceae bacterium]|nr:cyclase family protein [Phototrophicaceae bacterium]